MIDKEQKKIIENNAMALATVNEDGSPHVIAVGFAKVSEGMIVITDNYMSATTSNIKRDPRISLAVWTRNWEDDCKGFEFICEAEYHTGGKWHEFVKGLKENEEYPANGAIVAKVKKVKKLA